MRDGFLGLKLVSLASLLFATACGSLPDDCHQTLTCHGAGGASGSSGTGGQSGAGGAAPGCDPSTHSGPVDGSCGVFVSSSKGSDNNEGSQAKPMKTLAHAVSIAKGQPIYACGEDFEESLTVPAGTTIFGALACKSGWAYDASKPTTLTAAADEIPLTLASGSGTTHVEDFAITSADVNKQGGSSIAVLADGVAAELERCVIEAGSGAKGKAGPPQNQVQTLSSADGQSGKPGCVSVSGVIGGDPGMNTCGSDMPAGGSGGNGGVASGGPGGDGNPTNRGTAPFDGKGGRGDSGAGCGPGDSGDPGQPGETGAGAHGFGTLAASGFTGPQAKPGASAGTFGQGGGGGGGAMKCGATNAGPSGGGGGAGGCGGKPGTAGGSGGSSIGVVSVNATISLIAGSITAHEGGDGGTGGDGQTGGNGGGGGPLGGSGACNGGNGGKGGRGGSGGGGGGGHSVGVAFQGGKPPALQNTQVHSGMAGGGAIGGDMDMSASGTGDAGKQCQTLDFGNGKCTK